MIVQNLRCLIKDKETHKNTAKLLLIKNFSEKYRFLLPIPAQEVDALLMLYPTETLDLLPPDALLLLILSIKKGISDRAPWDFQVRTTKRKVRKMACTSRFSDFWVWQGQKDLNPRHAVLEAMYRARKAHRYADFKPFLFLKNIIDAILMLLVIP